MSKSWLWIGLALAVAIFVYLAQEPNQPPPGIIAARAPEQTAVDHPPIRIDEYQIFPVASFSLEARVLGREDYSMDREADLAPTDLAFGWGPMSDTAILEHFDINQSGRWYRWYADELPLTRKTVETHSANMHLVPASETVADELDDVEENDLVRLDGFLINVVADDGWRWNSSLTRTDTGGGACELIYVTDLLVIARP